MAAHPGGAKTDGGIGCARKPAHRGIARRQRALDWRSSGTCRSRGSATSLGRTFFESVSQQSGADGDSRPDGKDCLDANISFLELVGASREAVLAGSTKFWADESTPTAISEE